MTLTEITKAILSLRPNAKWSLAGTELSNLQWDDLEQTRPTDEEIIAEVTRIQQQKPLDDCKAKAKDLLLESDWAVLPDVNLQNKSDFEFYRSQLRNLVINPVTAPIWPIKPEPIWAI